MEARMMVVVVGNFAPERMEQMRLAVLRAQAEPLFCATVDQARDVLQRPDQPAPRCIFADGATLGLDGFVGFARGEARLFSVPIVVIVPSVDEQAFSEVHAMGADDVVVAGEWDAVTRRAKNLAEFDPALRPPITQGRAVVAHSDMGRRRVLGRILRQAGFDVSFAAEETEIVDVARSGDPPSLLVAALDGRASLGAVQRVRGSLAAAVPAVVLAPARDLRELGREADGLGAVAVTSELAPPDNLLFLANELMRENIENARASSRVLFGALCAYRPAGEIARSWGLTYNLSREGLYVRTLDAPKAGTEVWLELRPPRSERAVQIAATVVWRRGLASGAGGAAPPGFGARILPESCSVPSLSAYHEGYERLRAEPRVLR